MTSGRRPDPDAGRQLSGRVRTVVGVGALLDVEELVQGERVVVSCQPLLVQLQLPQALVLLVAGRAGVLHQVEPGLGGVVAQRAVVDARLGAVAAVLLLQVLRTTRRRRRWLDLGWTNKNNCICVFIYDQKKLVARP